LATYETFIPSDWGTGPSFDSSAVDWTALDGGGAADELAPPPLPPLDDPLPPQAAMNRIELTASGTTATRDIFMRLSLLLDL
jgi:hypothetical protein